MKILFLAWLFWAAVNVAQATDVHISAEFRPDLDNPNQRDFINTTPWSGVCAGVHLATCISNGWWSIDMRVRGTKLGDGARDWGRGSFFIGMPGPRRVTIVSEDGRDSHPLDLHIIGAAMRLTDAAQDGSRNPASLGGALGCRIGLTNGSALNYSAMRMFLREDGGEGSSACSLHWLDANDFDIRELDLVYRLTTPKPLTMRSGVYRGSTTYTVGGTGQGADFDLGNDVTLTDSSVTVHFTLSVQHAFRLDLPPGSERALLSPRGGWSSWTDHGVAPGVLERELPFSISSSGKFSVFLQCQYPQADGRCGIRSEVEDALDAPLDVSVTLPGFRELQSGAAAVDVALSAQGVPPVFGAEAVIIGRPSRLRFAVQGEAVRAMLQRPGAHYRGDVTVVFDANP